MIADVAVKKVNLFSLAFFAFCFFGGSSAGPSNRNWLL
jgi:hypothetical protein